MADITNDWDLDDPWRITLSEDSDTSADDSSLADVWDVAASTPSALSVAPAPTGSPVALAAPAPADAAPRADADTTGTPDDESPAPTAHTPRRRWFSKRVTTA